MMSSTSRTAASRREARKQNRAANSAKADEQERNLPKQAGTAKAKAAEAPKPRPSKKTRREVIADQRKATEKRADDQERAIRPVEIDTDISVFTQRNQPVPLNVLNAKAREHDRDRQDEARAISKAAGKAAYNAASGRRASRAKSKFATVRDAQDALAKAQAEKQDTE